ncbi:MAG TPA: cupin domain-containing protein [Bdellovibrionota bacterium]|nr:cupin domain-containing protein [Bdellovibrionota bacterium]
MTEPTVEGLIRLLDLRPHPEGGYFAETYRAKGVIPKKGLPSEYGSDRNYSTAIYYLLPQGSVSKLHRLRTDEIFHFYLGGSMSVAQILPDGTTETVARDRSDAPADSGGDHRVCGAVSQN